LVRFFPEGSLFAPPVEIRPAETPFAHTSPFKSFLPCCLQLQLYIFLVVPLRPMCQERWRDDEYSFSLFFPGNPPPPWSLPTRCILTQQSFPLVAVLRVWGFLPHDPHLSSPTLSTLDGFLSGADRVVLIGLVLSPI